MGTNPWSFKERYDIWDLRFYGRRRDFHPNHLPFSHEERWKRVLIPSLDNSPWGCEEMYLDIAIVYLWSFHFIYWRFSIPRYPREVIFIAIVYIWSWHFIYWWFYIPRYPRKVIFIAIVYLWSRHFLYWWFSIPKYRRKVIFITIVYLWSWDFIYWWFSIPMYPRQVIFITGVTNMHSH